jgi:hypothetical protein
MAQFGWAYVSCTSSAGGDGAASGPANSIQFMTASGEGVSSGSLNFSFYTGSEAANPVAGHNVVLSGSLFVTGAYYAGYRPITTTPFTVNDSDYILGATAAGNLEVTLPTPSAAITGRILVVKDESAAARFITITGSGFNIDNASSFVMSGSNPAINLYCNGTDWFIF